MPVTVTQSLHNLTGNIHHRFHNCIQTTGPPRAGTAQIWHGPYLVWSMSDGQHIGMGQGLEAMLDPLTSPLTQLWDSGQNCLKMKIAHTVPTVSICILFIL